MDVGRKDWVNQFNDLSHGERTLFRIKDPWSTPYVDEYLIVKILGPTLDYCQSLVLEGSIDAGGMREKSGFCTVIM
jgi:hypothetical protein